MRCEPCWSFPSFCGLEGDIEEQIARLEVHYLSNADARLTFALLSDWADSDDGNCPQ